MTDLGNVGGNVLRITAYTDPGDKFLETGAIIIDFYLTGTPVFIVAYLI